MSPNYPLRSARRGMRCTRSTPFTNTSAISSLQTGKKRSSLEGGSGEEIEWNETFRGLGRKSRIKKVTRWGKENEEREVTLI